MANRQIILASSSPRRKELMDNLGIQYLIITPIYEEIINNNFSAEEVVKDLARGKAEAVAKENQEAIVIGADTVVEFEGKILGKPKDTKQAESMLEEINGKCVKVVTGYAVVVKSENKVIVGSKEGLVYMRKYPEHVISHYVQSGEPMDKAGAFAIQGRGGLLIERIEGDYFAIVGLPIYEVVTAILKLDPSFIERY